MSTGKFIFFGTPRFARIVLDTLRDMGMYPSLIITAPPKPQGRHLRLTPSDVHQWAIEQKIPVITPQKLNEDAVKAIADIQAECFVVAAYGKILRKQVLDLPPKGVLNVHPSLLPKFRGASPIESTILSEETETGVSIILLDEEVDHGPILAQKTVSVSPWPPKGSVLTDLLAREGGTLLGETLPLWIKGQIVPVPQDHSRATHTKKISKTDGEITLSANPLTAYKKICSFDEWPGVYFFVTRNGKHTRVVVKDAVYDGTTLTILRVIPEGKKEMDYRDFLRGNQ